MTIDGPWARWAVLVTLTLATVDRAHAQLDQEEAVREEPVGSNPIQSPPRSRIGAHKLAAILVSFEDATIEITPRELRHRLFAPRGSANAWFREVSYGKFWFEGALDPAGGDIFSVTIPFSSRTCDREAWAPAVQAAAEADGFDASHYDFVFYFFAGPCRSAARPLTHPPSAWIDNASLRAIAHEGGHALGWYHSSSYLCRQGTEQTAISGVCTFDEYGDPFDVMGGHGTYHVNNHKRGQVGWLDPGNTTTVEHDGQYTVCPVEGPPGPGISVRIPRVIGPRGVDQYLYLECRRPFGFDRFPDSAAVVRGVTLRLAGPYDRKGRSYLVDTHPGTPEVHDAPLMVGETFVDPATDIAIQVIEVTPQGATVDIRVGDPLTCVPHPPSASFTPAQASCRPGGAVKVAMTLRNEDIDGSIAILVGELTVPPGWRNPRPRGFEGTLVPGGERRFHLDFSVPADAVAGQYKVTATTTNMISGLTGSDSVVVTVH